MPANRLDALRGAGVTPPLVKSYYFTLRAAPQTSPARHGYWHADNRPALRTSFPYGISFAPGFCFGSRGGARAESA